MTDYALNTDSRLSLRKAEKGNPTPNGKQQKKAAPGNLFFEKIDEMIEKKTIEAGSARTELAATERQLKDFKEGSL